MVVIYRIRDKIIRRSQENVREIILNVARTIFARFGFKKATMNEIAQAAHKGKSSIYNYFRSKEEIFQAVVEKESRLLGEELTKAVEKEETPQKKFRTYIISRMQILNRLANFYSALKDEYFEHYRFIEKIRGKYIKDEINMIKKILNEGVNKGIFLVKDLNITAFAIITAIKGLEYPWAIENDSSETEKSIDYLLDILFNGIVKK